MPIVAGEEHSWDILKRVCYANTDVAGAFSELLLHFESSDMSLHGSKGKNILLTGGARGIGRVMARHLLSLPKNHRLFIIDINEEELTYNCETHLRAYHPRVGYCLADLRQTSEIREAVRKAVEFFGGHVDVLVNNAGIARSSWTAGNGTMADPATAEQWDEYVSINLTAPFLTSQAIIPYMQNRYRSRLLDEGGCIIHISSFRAHQSDPNCEGYSATKAGLLGLTQAMAVSGQQWGIRCNAISPGWVSVKHECREADEKAAQFGIEDSAHNQCLTDEARAERDRMRIWADRHTPDDHAQHPAGRVGRGEDVAEAVEYVMNAGFMSGQELIVDGGANRKKNPKV